MNEDFPEQMPILEMGVIADPTPRPRGGRPKLPPDPDPDPTGERALAAFPPYVPADEAWMYPGEEDDRRADR